MAEEEDVVLLAAADEIALVVGVGAEEGGAHEGGAVAGDFADEAIGGAAVEGGGVGVWSGGEVVRAGAAAHEEVVGRVDIDGVDSVVAGAAEVGGPEQVAEVVVEFEHEAFLPAAVVALYGGLGALDVEGEGGCADINIVEVVGDELAAGAVAIVGVEGVVAEEHDSHVVVVVVAIVEAVVEESAGEGGGHEGGAIGRESADEDVAALWVVDLRAFELDGGAAVEGGVVGRGRDGEVGRSGGAEDDEFVEGVDEHAVGHVGVGAAQIGGVEAVVAVGVEFENANVGVAVGSGVECSDRGWVAAAVVEHEAGGVGVFVGVVCRGGAPVVGGGASVGRKVEVGVDDEREGVVVRTELDAECRPVEDELGGDLNLLAIDCLVGVGLEFHDVEHGSLEHYVAILELRFVDAFVLHSYLVGVGAWGDEEVVFQVVVRGVDAHVYARVEGGVVDLAEQPYVRGPARGVVADEVVLVAVVGVEAFYRGCFAAEEMKFVDMVAPAIGSFLLRAMDMLQVGVGGVLHKEGEAARLEPQGGGSHLGAEEYVVVPLALVFRKLESAAYVQSVAHITRWQQVGCQQ